MKAHQFISEIKNILVKHYAGSIAYGTNLPTSDVDIRGIFCADPINIRTPFFPVREIEDQTEIDTKFYELSHFMKLCLDCNPNIIETLWVDETDILFKTPAYDLLRENRSELLSSKIAFTTSGYAISQLSRIKNHNKWINKPQPEQPPQPKDFITLIRNFGAAKIFPGAFTLIRDNYRLIPYGGDIYGLYNWQGYKSYDCAGKLNTLYEGDCQTLELPEMIVKFNKVEYKQAKEKHQLYWNWKQNRNPVRSKLEEQYGYDCYADDTEFLTNTGWKSYDDITTIDKLASFDMFQHTVDYEHYINRFDGVYNGNMYQLTGQHTDVLVTANHNMVIREFSRTNNEYNSDWILVEASHLPEFFDSLYTIIPKTNRQKLPADFNQDVLSHVDIKNYLRILGWYISNGTCTFDKNGKPITISISQSKPQSRLTQTLNRQRNLGNITCSESIYEAYGANLPEHKWCFPKPISTLIYNDCNHLSSQKRIPEWVYDLTKHEMTLLLCCLMQGDGTKKKQDGTYVYYTSNSLLADDVQRLSFLCGYRASKWGPYDTPTEFNDNLQMYQVHVNTMAPRTKRYRRSLSVKEIDVTNQRIVCFTVPKHHTLVTRRNGKIALHANSKHAMHLVRLLRTGVEALQTGEILVKRPDAEELLSIRNGAWTYEELVEYAEMMDNKIKTLYKTTDLPKKPNIKAAAKLVMELQDLIWKNE